MTFADITSSLAPELERLNTIIAEALDTPTPLMNEIVTRYLLTKGKQIRPVMVLLSARLLGEISDRVLHAAAAMEMLHNASLIHDDVVDDTLTRRGRQTINAIWDNHIAVLVGDYFMSGALNEGVRTESIEIVRALSELGKELSLGEIHQICNARGHQFRIDDYYTAIRKRPPRCSCSARAWVPRPSTRRQHCRQHWCSMPNCWDNASRYVMTYSTISRHTRWASHRATTCAKAR